MSIVSRYLNYLDDRFRDAGKFGSSNEFRGQMLPWAALTLVLMFASSAFTNFRPNSFAQTTLALVVLAPLFIGLGLVARSAWKASWQRIDEEPVIRGSDD